MCRGVIGPGVTSSSSDTRCETFIEDHKNSLGIKNRISNLHPRWHPILYVSLPPNRFRFQHLLTQNPQHVIIAKTMRQVLPPHKSRVHSHPQGRRLGLGREFANEAVIRLRRDRSTRLRPSMPGSRLKRFDFATGKKCAFHWHLRHASWSRSDRCPNAKIAQAYCHKTWQS